ncbi:MAG TPA: hypothetical protein VKH41_10055, partial [Myxococcota bacterium]|nr:hypothetical protein [Myxococcota bacterium]
RRSDPTGTPVIVIVIVGVKRAADAIETGGVRVAAVATGSEGESAEEIGAASRRAIAGRRETSRLRQ